MTRLDEALAAHRAGDFARAEALYEAARGEEPWRAAHNLGILHSSLGRLDRAEQAFREALLASPDNPESRYSLAHALLAAGRWTEAWPLYEARRELPRLEIPDAPKDMSEWMGEPLAGKRLLVIGEQGFGDQLMFARFLPEIAAAGARVSYRCRPGLVRLIQGALPDGADLSAMRFDAWALAGSLPLRLGATPETLPPPAPLALTAAPGGQGIGIVTRGRPSHLNDANRSLSGDAEQRLRALGRDLSPDATGARDFRDTARIIAGLELVISVDTGVAHLAATLGKPTWILLPHVGTDWRWMRGRSDSPWYPTARLFRQPRPHDWGAVLDEVEAALR
jgi:tetratricopeptide (TPR) repeat protein